MALASLACVNNVTALQLPITSVSTTTTGSGTTRGIAVSMGDPYQLFSFRPAVSNNNTWVYSIHSCDNASSYECIAELGGLYNSQASHTSQVVNGVSSWNGSLDSEFQNVPSYVLNNDIFLAGGNGDIYGYPFISWTQASSSANASNQAALGLGYNSTFLSAAAEAGTAPSKDYSIWTGVESTDYTQSVDGMLIIGGYDEARKKGDFVNFTALSDTPLYVEITDITWEDTPGNITSLIPNGTTMLLGTLEPFFDAIYLPSDVYDNFWTASNAIYNATLDKLVYNSSSTPTGTMTVTLSNGYKTEISGSDLFDYPQEYDETGNEAVTNYDLVTAKVEVDYEYPNRAYWLFIGVPFMTMNYVVTDFENNRWMMAPAVRDNFGQPTALKLASLCTQKSATNTSTSTSSGHQKSTTAAIAGGVGGGVGGLLLIGGIIALILFLRHRKGRAAAQRDQPRVQQQRAASTAYSETTEATELPSPTKKHVESWVSAHRDVDYAKTPFMSEMQATSGPVEMPAHHHE